jgi:hypothetical protein
VDRTRNRRVVFQDQRGVQENPSSSSSSSSFSTAFPVGGPFFDRGSKQQVQIFAASFEVGAAADGDPQGVVFGASGVRVRQTQGQSQLCLFLRRRRQKNRWQRGHARNKEMEYRRQIKRYPF